MCRTDLGECVVEGCDARITCRDTGGYCNGHDPQSAPFCDCDDECTCPPAAAPPPINVVKRLRYDIAATERWHESERIRAARAAEGEQKAAERLTRLRAALAAASAPVA